MSAAAKRKPAETRLTAAELRMVRAALEWVEAAGDYSEFAETSTTREMRALWTALTKLRDARTVVTR